MASENMGLGWKILRHFFRQKASVFVSGMQGLRTSFNALFQEQALRHTLQTLDQAKMERMFIFCQDLQPNITFAIQFKSSPKCSSSLCPSLGAGSCLLLSTLNLFRMGLYSPNFSKMLFQKSFEIQLYQNIHETFLRRIILNIFAENLRKFVF